MKGSYNSGALRVSFSMCSSRLPLSDLMLLLLIILACHNGPMIPPYWQGGERRARSYHYLQNDPCTSQLMTPPSDCTHRAWGIYEMLSELYLL